MNLITEYADEINNAIENIETLAPTHDQAAHLLLAVRDVLYNGGEVAVPAGSALDTMYMENLTNDIFDWYVAYDRALTTHTERAL